MIRCILFDLDGTLVEAKLWHYVALNKALETNGHKAIPYDTHLSDFDGLPTRVKLENLGITGKEALAVNKSKQIFTRKLIEEECKVDLELRRAIAKLWHLEYRLAVCSNAIKDSCAAMIWGLGLQDYFWFWLSSEDVANPKPDPECWFRAMQMLGVDPDETVIIEDSKVGIASAEASGAWVLEVESPKDVRSENVLQFIEEIGNAFKYPNAPRGCRPEV